MRGAVAAAVVLVATVGWAQPSAVQVEASGFEALLAREKADLASLQEQMLAAHDRIEEEHRRWVEEHAQRPHADPDYEAFEQRHQELVKQHAKALVTYQGLVARFAELGQSADRQERLVLAAQLASAHAEHAALVSDHEQMAEHHVSLMRQHRLASRQ